MLTMVETLLEKLVLIKIIKNMRYLILLFTLLTFNIYSQDIEKIKQSDVFFIVHGGKNGNFETKKENNDNSQIKTINYNYVFTDGPKSVVNKIKLSYSNYLDFDELEKGNHTLSFKINKSFLKKNKDIIIDRKFMHKIGYYESYNLLSKAKTIFLIDKDEINNKMVVLKKVRLNIPSEYQSSRKEIIKYEEN